MGQLYASGGGRIPKLEPTDNQQQQQQQRNSWMAPPRLPSQQPQQQQSSPHSSQQQQHRKHYLMYLTFENVFLFYFLFRILASSMTQHGHPSGAVTPQQQQQSSGGLLAMGPPHHDGASVVAAVAAAAHQQAQQMQQPPTPQQQQNFFNSVTDQMPVDTLAGKLLQEIHTDKMFKHICPQILHPSPRTSNKTEPMSHNNKTRSSQTIHSNKSNSKVPTQINLR